MAVTAAIQLGWLGTEGLAEIALRSARAARYCRQSLLSVEGVEAAADAPVLREFAVRLPIEPETAIERLIERRLPRRRAPSGRDTRHTEYEGALLVATTERRTRAEIDSFVAALDKAVR